MGDGGSDNQGNDQATGAKGSTPTIKA